MNTKVLVALAFLLAPLISFSQNAWQQKIKYTMNIDMDVETNKYTGTQQIEYWNNSPDTLHKVFFHLYWNAFQPGSMMDTRSRRQGSVSLRKDRNGNDVGDWDPRVKDRIIKLDSSQIGWQNVTRITMNGRPQKTRLHETILEVQLDRPIAPRTKVSFNMNWDAQVPLQIRRSGRDNPNTTVRYTMTQWYPKMAEYDKDGWHPNPYVGREFYGVWGDFDVTIKIAKDYILGGTGNLQNAASIGYGYEPAGTREIARPISPTLSWRFIAPNVHDFAWAADPGYKHLTRQIQNGPTIHVLYKNPDNDPAEEAAWKEIADAAVTVYPFIKKNFGEYPYKQYSFIHGGDGGMEYPMATMLASSSLGTAFHEWMHSWYQMMLGTNEALYAWMDEGFTEFATNKVEEFYRQQGRKNLSAANLRKSDSIAAASRPLLHGGNYAGYLTLARSGREEPLTTHADHFNTNYAYSNAAYSKGAVFLEQLGYIVGGRMRDSILINYYRQWRFRHPDVDDFMRVAEKRSGIQLDWYKEYWVNGTKTIDYAIDSLWEGAAGTQVRIRNVGAIPMPMDVRITYRDGTTEWHYVPAYLMFGNKEAEEGQERRKVYEPWKWTHPAYTITTSRKIAEISNVEIDPSYRMADMDRKNNKIDLNVGGFGRRN